MGRFPRGELEEENIIVVPELLQKRSQNDQGFVPKRTVTKRVNKLKHGNEKKDKKEDHPKIREHFDEKQITKMSSGAEDELPFEEKVS